MTAAQIVNTMYSYLNTSALNTAANGDVYKHNERPLGSSKEDVVISILGAPNVQIQRALVNVNVWIPDKLVGGTYYPDHARITALSGTAWEVLKQHVGNGFHFSIDEQLIVRDKETNQYFINNRVEFYAKNI